MEMWRCGDVETWRHGEIETWRHGDMETWRHRDMDMETTNVKQKPTLFSLTHLPFAHRANGSLLFFCLSMKKQMEVIR
jgi:hypothetical protein